MARVWRGFVALVLAVVLLWTGAVGAAATETRSGATQDADAIALDQRFEQLPDDPGNVSVALEYDIPDRVVSLRTTIPGNATVTSTVGFDRENATTYAWDEESDRPTITYRYRVNRTAHRTGPKGAHGNYLAADVGEWALFTRPTTPTEYEYAGDEPAFDRQSIVEGEGAAGEWLVYLGPQQTFTRHEYNQTFQLVVPEAATMAESPREVLRSLSRASGSLEVGDRDESVFVVAAPTGQVPWAVRGFQTGDADMWVKADEQLSDPENVWFHEYVHTRQSFETALNARWLDEGIASYYATLLTFEHQSLTFAGFADQLASGSGAEYAKVALESPDSWRGFADYYKGGLVAGYLDRQLRLESPGDDRLQQVVAALNEHERVNASVFEAEMATVGSERLRPEVDRVTASAANVTMWNESAHRSAYGPMPATIRYSLSDPEGGASFNVSGPYRRTEITTDSPLMVATGETVTVRARARNVGGREGSYQATLQVNGTSVDSATGSVDPNETAVVPLEHTFVIPGRYVLSVDGASVPVQVSDPVTADVASVVMQPTVVDQGENATLMVTVENDEAGPAQRELIITRNFREVTRGTVYLDAGERKQVSFEISFPRAGDARVAVNGNWPTQVDVDPSPIETATPTPNGTAVPRTTETPPTTTEGTGPGLGAVSVAAALALAALLARRRR